MDLEFTSALPFAVLALTLSSATGCSEPARAEVAVDPVLRVEATEIHTAPAEQRVLLHGNVEGGEASPLAFLVAGRLVDRRVDVGDRVEAGQILARLDASGYRNGVRAAASTLSQTEAQRDQRNRDESRAAALVGRGAIAVQQAESAMTGVRVAEGAAVAAAAELNERRRQLRESVLRATRDGIITESFVDEGSVVASGQPIFAFAADESRGVWVEASLEVGRHIRIGDTAAVELNSSGTVVEAHVDRLSPALSARGLVPVHLLLDARESSAVIGEGAVARLRVQAGEDRLSAPIGAVVDPTGGHPFLWRISDDARVHAVPIEVLGMGASGEVHLRPLDENRQESAALEAGTRIVVAGRALLIDGDEVTVQESALSGPQRAAR